ncbi:hypothetical protein FNV43_RR04557 [Rhamnella rubrinervis]|uniref:Uncharacterized protein n=1 Tax=Rhamnella rubrinervis TaxID=2594499 RepID=A0A8K0HM03_9ROSA|nr:hypothetical protein FNV43_RR04557 [Rhamnella rubrinervis]
MDSLRMTFWVSGTPWSRPKKPRDLLAKSNNILRLEVLCRMKKSILSPEHMITYGLWTNPEAEEEGIVLS